MLLVCVYAIYVHTCSFMNGGWPVLNMWLAEAKKSQDTAVIVEILQVCTADIIQWRYMYDRYTCAYICDRIWENADFIKIEILLYLASIMSKLQV